jgi:predicted molibdopterin-dependent oxidoreductase YjgC
MKRDLRVYEGVDRGQKFEIEVDGEKMTAYEGETIASVLHADGRLTMNYTPKRKAPRGMYCGIGLCYNCIMVIDGVPSTRACQTLATPGCKVKTQEGLEK